MANIYSKVLDKIFFYYEGYSREHRFTTQPFHLEKITKAIKDYKYDCDDILAREPLIEHIGSLPIIATTIYPYIKDDSVDLGKALIMLAIHDAGELITGDEIVFTKNTKGDEKEKEAALKLLPSQYHETYLDIEEQKTNTGKFAKAIDQIAPDIIDLMTPKNIAHEYYKRYIGDEITPKDIKMKLKHKYMVWNNFMKNLHLEILNRLEAKLNS